MRKTVSQNGITVKAYAGCTGVLLAFNLDDDKEREGLLGFSIQKDDKDFLPAMIPFPGQKHDPGELIPTNVAPVQKFRWSDYTTDAATTYKYTVFAVHGTPDQPDLGKGAEITVTTEPRDASAVIRHPEKFITVSNRAVASSQAFSRKFPQTTKKLNAALARARPKGKAKKTDGILTADEMKWLSNGLLEEIVAFIRLAEDDTFALDVAIYQYELEDICTAINDAALKRGVAVRLIYHAKAGDSQTARNVASAKDLPAGSKFGRVTNAIFHHKFIVLSKIAGGVRTPVAVLCGSTNFTSNGVFAQANNVQISSDPAVMKNYADQFQFLFEQPAHTPAVTAVQDTEQNILSPTASLQVGFSPRNRRADLTFFATLINGAKQDVLFATAFGIDKVVMDALAGQPHDSILRFGIQDKPTKQITGLHQDQTADFEAASTLPEGLDGWLDEHRTPGAQGNILIHDKIVVIDFTSDNPTVINGSHNYSNNASAHNDENYLIVHGNTAMADCLGVEVMRLYDHYRFRFVTKASATKSKGSMKITQKPMTLDTTNGWTDSYYDPASLKFADRMIFSGTLHVGSIQQVRSAAKAPGTAAASAAHVRAPRKTAAKKKVPAKKKAAAKKKAMAKKKATAKKKASKKK
jgi:phosphatidylserine/phosphatidylglycerophosphate/cardiolipin synthase-like enzyme